MTSNQPITTDTLFKGEWKAPTVDAAYIFSTLLAGGAVLLVGVLYVVIMLVLAFGWIGIGALVLTLGPDDAPLGTKLLVLALCVLAAPLLCSIALGMLRVIVPAKPREGVECILNRREEPLLWDVVEHVCRTMRAPVPKRIVVTHDANAAVNAGPIWRSLLGLHDISLMIGMPLAGSLTLREFLGVLAHETGHLRQRGSGIVSVAAGSLMQRLQWGVHGRTESDWQIELFEEYADTPMLERVWMRVRRAGNAISRLICGALLGVAGAAWSFARRRQEINADLHEIALAGSMAFESASHRILTLGVAEERASEQVRRMTDKRTAPEDIPALILDHAQMLGAEGQTAAKRDVASEGAAEWFDAYPEHRERIRRARELNQPGIVAIEAPAIALFQNFDLACQRATYGFLETIAPNHLARLDRKVPREELREGLAEQLAGRRALASFLAMESLAWRPALPAITELSEPADPKATLARLRSARQVRPAPGARDAAERYRDAHERWTACLSARQALELDPGKVISVRGIGKVTRWTVTREIDRASNDLSQSVNIIDPVVEAAEARISSALRLLCVKNATALIPDAERLRAEAGPLVARAGMLRAAFPIVRQVREMSAVSAALAAATHVESLRKQAWQLAVPHATAMAERLEQIRSLGRNATPPGMTKGELGLWMAGPPTGPESFYAVHDNADTLAERFRRAHETTIGRLAEIAQRVEQALDVATAERKERQSAPNR